MTTPDHTQSSGPVAGTPRRRNVARARTSEARPATVRVRDEADLLALIPYTFGFHPQESLVMMLLGHGGRPMFARVDMPAAAHEADAACAELRHAAIANGGRRAALVAYTDHDAAGLLAVEQAADELTAVGVEMMLAVRADGTRWWRLLPQPALDGVPYDLSSHPITATGVLEGRVTHDSRARLAESLLPADLDKVEAVAAAVDELKPLAADRACLRGEALWLQSWVEARVYDGGAGRDVAPEELARVVRALAHVDLRDVAWASMSRHTADEHVRLWTDVVVQCPVERLAPAAGLLAFAAWLSGHGALSWCAVDRALQSDPDHNLARLVAQTLDSAMPPSTWQGIDRRSLSLLSD